MLNHSSTAFLLEQVGISLVSKESMMMITTQPRPASLQHFNAARPSTFDRMTSLDAQLTQLRQASLRVVGAFTVKGGAM